MQDSVLNSINTNICLFALVPAEVCHFEAQAAFLCYLFIFLAEKKSAQVIFLLDKISWVCVCAFSCSSNFVCFKKWYFRFLCDLFIPHMEEQCCLAVSGVGTYAEQVPWRFWLFRMFYTCTVSSFWKEGKSSLICLPDWTKNAMGFCSGLKSCKISALYFLRESQDCLFSCFHSV